MKVLVTGGAGFIGSHLVDRLVMEGHEAVVVDNLATENAGTSIEPPAFTRWTFKAGGLERVFRNERPNVVMHLAAQMDVRKSVEDPMFDAQVNVLGTLNVLQQAVKHGVRKVIFSSSGSDLWRAGDLSRSRDSCDEAVVSLWLEQALR
jgi:UDP-glucose 4-epimerase